VTYLLRLVLPDRPGALGAVASALGTVDADILSVDVIERGTGCATDDFVVDLPPEKLPDTLISAAATVEGVQVVSIRPYAGQLDPHRELELLEALAQDPSSNLALLADGAARVFRAGWALVLSEPDSSAGGRGTVLARGGAAPELTELDMPWWPPAPARALTPDPEWAPADWERMDTELAVSPFGKAALLVGRPALRWLPSELVRLQHLAAIAASVAPVESD
jgi:hypothetical protein